MTLILFSGFLMQLGLLDAAVRLLMLTAIPSIAASTALIAIMACSEELSRFFGFNGSDELDYELDAVTLVFVIVEFSLTGGAIIFGLVKHFLFR